MENSTAPNEQACEDGASLQERTTTPDAHSAAIKQAYEDFRAKKISLATFGAIVRQERGL